jgi:DNA-binding XRE family transcriptional regulator
MTDPQTPDAWQEAVDAADRLMTINSAMRYGLLRAAVEPETIDEERCLDLLHRGAQRGIYPADPAARRRAIGRWLRTERAALGMTQLSLGRACGISQQWIQRIESGQLPIRDDALARLRASIAQLREEQS